MSESIPHFLPDIYQELYGCAARGPSTPSSLRRFFLLMLRGHWAAAENHGPDLSESLGCLTWKPVNPVLGIELNGTQIDSTLQHMIWVRLGNFRAVQLTFGNRGQTEDETNAEERFFMPCKAQLLISHDSPSMDQSFDMAWSTFCFLMGFQASILDALGGEGAGFKPELLGDPTMRENAPKTSFRVDVGASLVVNVAVSTAQESHLLKRVSLLTHPSV